MKKRILACLFLLAGLVAGFAADTVSLAGKWRFQLDRTDAGIRKQWFGRNLSGAIRLPGSLPEQGIGDPPSTNTPWVGSLDPLWWTTPNLAPYVRSSNFKFPYWLTPETYYAGAAWYQRGIEIPSGWRGNRVVLTLERPHWETRVWVDGKFVGANNSLGTPHEYDLGQIASGKHRLTIRVDNSRIVDIGENSHSITDHTQGNWNGIVGALELRATPLVWIEDAQVYPHVATKSVTVKVRIGNATGQAGNGQLELTAALKSEGRSPKSEIRKAISWTSNGGSVDVELPLGPGAQLWDEFHPALYSLTARLLTDGRSDSTVHSSFGLREISTRGTQFTLNGRKIFIRGTLECCIFPKTGHPPTDVDSWKRILRIARAHGLNLLRFHSWCPPEAAFVAADEMGIYYQVECSSWANQSTTLGDGKPVDQWIYEEADRMLKTYGNHPSFLLMPYGNEPGGKNYSSYLSKWVAHYKAQDPRRLYTSGSGWPQIPENQFDVTPDPRIQLWGDGIKSRINAKPPETRTDYRDYICKRAVPVISHEIGQWCVYPDFDEIPKYTGYLKPKNFEIFRDSLKAHHMGDQARQFLLASGKLQTLCYKEDIESALRTPGMGGFELLDLHDFPGQGTALVGVLDPFWDDKGYVTAAEYSRFCNSTVPLARMSKRVFTTDENFKADLEVAYFGPAPMDAVAKWKLVNDRGEAVASGELPEKNLPVDNGISLGSVTVPLKNLTSPARYKFVVRVTSVPSVRSGAAILQTPRQDPRATGTFENDWDIWFYPPQVAIETPAEVSVVDDLTDAALATLDSGGKVLLTISPARVKNLEKDKVALGFSSIFWNTAWTHRQAPTTLGILCDPQSPALADFPTEYHSNWQWWYLMSRASAMILDDLPAKLRPTVQVIDDWVTNHRLALLFEAKVDNGKLMVCSVDLKNDLEADPVRRQFRRSVLRYMEGKRFNPKVPVSVEQVRSLIAPLPTAKGLPVNAITADSAEQGREARNAIDLDPQTP